MEPIQTQRLDKVRQAMTACQIDTLMVSVAENRRYVSGFTAEDGGFDESSGVLLIGAAHQILATDSRFDLQARAEARGWDVVCYAKGLIEELPGLLSRLGTRCLGFEALRLSVKDHQKIGAKIAEAGLPVKLVAVEEVVETLRVIKGEPEIEATARALAVAETAFADTLKVLAPGMTEIQAAWALEARIREAGAQSLSFPVICAAGPNAALPHAVPSNRPIEQGEPVLFDWGARLNGYCSDTSRTIWMGEPDQRFLDVYGTVLEAQARAIAAIREGVSSRHVDSLARDYIAEKGFKGLFGHGLGHGTGLAIHEAPRLSPLRDTGLRAGMIVTVEPGIYIAGWGGVRIENQVVVREDGAQVLNRLPPAWRLADLTSSLNSNHPKR